jgi:CHASE3 domain sensor protein
METSELLKMIDEYFDGELQKSDEQSLFVSLSANEQARNYFRQNRLLKSMTSEMQEAFPEKIEKKILSKIILNGRNKFLNLEIRPILACAAIIVLFCISLFFYSQVRTYKEDINQVHLDIQKQNRTIQILLNSLPTAEVQGKYSNAVIIKSN